MSRFELGQSQCTVGECSCSRLKRGETLSTTRVNECTLTLAASILYKNWTRSGAICNATLEEFEMCKLVQTEGLSNDVMSVQEHKTAQDGYGKLVFDPTGMLQYQETVCRVVNLGQNSPVFFLFCWWKASLKFVVQNKEAG